MALFGAGRPRDEKTEAELRHTVPPAFPFLRPLHPQLSTEAPDTTRPAHSSGQWPLRLSVPEVRVTCSTLLVYMPQAVWAQPSLPNKAADCPSPWRLGLRARAGKLLRTGIVSPRGFLTTFLSVPGVEVKNSRLCQHLVSASGLDICCGSWNVSTGGRGVLSTQKRICSNWAMECRLRGLSRDKNSHPRGTAKRQPSGSAAKLIL